MIGESIDQSIFGFSPLCTKPIIGEIKLTANTVPITNNTIEFIKQTYLFFSFSGAFIDPSKVGNCSSLPK